MRRRHYALPLLLALLLALSLAVLAEAGRWVNSAREQVELRQTVLFGDAAAAEGLTASWRVQSQRRLFWELKADLGGPEPEAEVSFRLAPGMEFSQAAETSMYLHYAGYAYSISNNTEAQSDLETAYGDLLLRPALDVAGRTGRGEKRTERVALGDYYETMPLQLSLQTETGYYSSGEAGDDKEFLADLFRAPVPEGAELEITVQKSGDLVKRVESTVVEQMEVTDSGTTIRYDLEAPYLGAFSDRRVYLLLEEADGEVRPHRGRDGAGIYVLPFDEGEEVPMSNRSYWELDRSEAGLLCPAEDWGEPLALTLSADQEKLLLLTWAEGELILHVYDAAGGRLLQRLALPGTEDGAASWERNLPVVYPSEGFLLVGAFNGDFCLLEESDAGYVPAVSGCLAVQVEQDGAVYRTESSCLLEDGMSAVWDGERLAWAAPSWGSGFYLAVADREGLAYLGRYTTSMDRELGDGNYRTEEGTLTVGPPESAS